MDGTDTHIGRRKAFLAGSPVADTAVWEKKNRTRDGRRMIFTSIRSKTLKMEQKKSVWEQDSRE